MRFLGFNKKWRSKYFLLLGTYPIFIGKSIKSGGQVGAHGFFWPQLKITFWSILTWKMFQFSKFLFLWISLGLYHVSPHWVEFPSLKPQEPEVILSRWSNPLFSGQKLKSSFWGPGFGPRAKLYMVSNTPR